MRFFILFFPLFLIAKDLDLSFLLTKPKSYVRDFYLTEYMKRTKNPALVFKAYRGLYKKRLLHQKILSKFDFYKEIYRCINPSPKDVGKIPVACILENGLSLYSLSKLSKKELKRIYNSLPKSIERKIVYIFLNKRYDLIFKDRKVAYQFIRKYPYRVIDQRVNDFSLFYGRGFLGFVKNIVLRPLPKLQASLRKLDYKIFSDKTKWWLFLNEMNFKDYKRAFEILKSFKHKKDREYFWLWLLSKDKKYLNRLLKYKRATFYTLYAYEEAGKKFKIVNKIIKKDIKNPKYDQTNPWSVLKFYSRLKKGKLKVLAKEVDSYKSEALKALVLDRLYRYSKNIFITPKMYEDKNVTFRAFVYAIARQESKFIPASVSPSYALGAMQMMPFLVRSMGGDVFGQFDYSENVKLSARHQKMLFRVLKDPLMVAYAYNAGVGFVKRKVLPYFKYKGEFEPFLSMEKIRYDETREYGKRVLRNFVIYSEIFSSPITLHKLLQK